MSEFTGKTTKEFEAHLKDLSERCGGRIKVNLARGDAARGNGEGVWAVCASPEDAAIYNDESTLSRKFKVYLQNDPIGDGGWHGRRWGSPVIAQTFGVDRPCAYAVDQGPLDAEVERIAGVLKPLAVGEN